MQDSPAPPTPPAEPAATAPTNWHALITVFLVVFIDLLGFGIVLPLLPRVGNELLPLTVGGKDTALGGVVLGGLLSVFSLMQFLFAPAWGRLSDRVGRRPILLIGLAGSVVFYALFGVALGLRGSGWTADSAWLALALLFVARVGQGIAGATIGTAQAVIADSTPPEKRKHGMALIGAAFGIGFTFGPLIGALAERWRDQVPGATGFVAAAISLAALLLALRRLPETRRPGDSPRVRRVFDWAATWAVLRTPVVGTLVLMFFLTTVGFGGFESTLSLLNQDVLGIGEDDNYLVFAYVGFVLLVTQGYLYRKLAKRLSEETFLTAGITLMGLGVAGLGGATWYWAQAGGSGGPLLAWVMMSLAVAVVGYAFVTPSVQALISRRTDPARQGEVLGVNQSAASLARIVGPLVALPLFKMDDSRLLPYAFGATLVLLMLPLVPGLRRPDGVDVSRSGVEPGREP